MGGLIFLAAAAFKLFWVDPYSHEIFLPDADPKGGIVTNALGMAAAQGEIESLSFVVSPEKDLKKVDFVPSDLMGPGGAKIPASEIDFALVKVWFRAANRWGSYWTGDQSKPKPIGDMIIHDDSIVKVDYEAKREWLRVDYREGSRYVDVSSRESKSKFDYHMQPVHDAERFVPMDLKKGFRQQFWVTVKVPKDARPGIYKGNIAVASNRKPLTALPVTLEVYPFALPKPKAHYDTSKPFFSYWMSVPTLQQLLGSTHDLVAAERKLHAIYRSLREHNAVNLDRVGKFENDSTDDLAVRTLLIARAEGMCANPLINGASHGDSRFVWQPGGKLLDPKDEPELYRTALSDYRQYVMKQNAVLDKYLGHHNCLYMNYDEIGPVVSRNSFGYWSIVHELGGGIWTDGQPHYDLSYIVDFNATGGGADYREARNWHAGGCLVATYASLFTGPACPDVWRRQKGMRCWYADYNGLHQYIIHAGPNRWNDFAHTCSGYCQMGMFYYSLEGIITTLAWEGAREGVDDIRYFTLLRRRALAAMASGDPAKVRLGREAIVWQDAIDPECVVDLWAHRRQTVGWIRKLIAAVGPEPEEPDTELKPIPLPPCTEGNEMPDGIAELWKYIDHYKHWQANRYDLAMKALVKVVKMKDAPAADRIKAAMSLADLLATQLRRGEAIKVIDQTLGWKDCEKASCVRLLQKKLEIQLPNVEFDAAYTPERLAAASATLTELLKIPGLSKTERESAEKRLARAREMAAAPKAEKRPGTKSAKKKGPSLDDDSDSIKLDE